MSRQSRRTIASTLGLLALAGLTTPIAGSAEAVRPNVLFIAVDDLKPAIGCMGDRSARTPHLDRLAARGTLFEHAYCMQAVCSPSRNAVLTGLRPRTLRIYDLATNFRLSVPEVVTLPQHFKNLGWKTEAMGKIFHVGHGNHEDNASWSVPHWQARSIGYALPENRARLTREEARFENRPPAKAASLPRGAAYESADVPDTTYGDGKIAEEAIRRLQAAHASPSQPFFLAVGFLKPHLPFCAPKKYWDLHDPAQLPMPARTTPPDGAPAFAPTNSGELRQYAGIPETGSLDETLTRRLIHGYYAATSYMDAQLGRLIDELDRLDLAKNTIIVLWGDHGWHLGDHGMWCKHTTYEQATRAPLIIVAPGKPSGRKTRSLAEFVDIYPTLCELAGLEPPSHLQGTSLVPILNDPRIELKATAFQVYPRGSKPHGPLLGQAARTDRWRYVEWQAKDGRVVSRELYDMRTDPGETVNVVNAPEHAAEVRELAGRIQAQLETPHPPALKLLPMDGR